MKIVNLLLICLTVCVLLSSCQKEELKVQVTYKLDSNATELYPDSIPSAKFTMTFHSGFNGDRLKVYYNGKEISNKKLITNFVAGAADVIDVEKQERNYVQFSLNGALSKTLLLDKNLNQLLIEHDIVNNQLKLTYLNYLLTLD